MLLVDTTVLVYATGDEHPLRAPALALLRDVVSARVRGTTTSEVLQEFAHVRARRRGRSEAFAQVERFAALLAPVCLVSAREAIDGLRLWTQVDRLGSVDSVLAAVAINRNWELVSADRSFGGVPRLTWRDLSNYQSG